MDSSKISKFSNAHAANVRERNIDTSNWPKPPNCAKWDDDEEIRCKEVEIPARLSDGSFTQVKFMGLVHRCANSPTTLGGISQEPDVGQIFEAQCTGNFSKFFLPPYKEIAKDKRLFDCLLLLWAKIGSPRREMTKSQCMDSEEFLALYAEIENLYAEMEMGLLTLAPILPGGIEARTLFRIFLRYPEIAGKVFEGKYFVVERPSKMA